MYSCCILYNTLLYYSCLIGVFQLPVVDVSALDEDADIDDDPVLEEGKGHSLKIKLNYHTCTFDLHFVLHNLVIVKTCLLNVSTTLTHFTFKHEIIVGNQ